ncbi:MAG: hypothetical protein KDB80_08470 [Planctomycetes bacterium]|nr:hypothetical protein [Planctomycetota bacterium]
MILPRWSSTAALSFALSATALAQDKSKPWYAMDYGPVISSTIEGFDLDNVAYKGRAVRLGDDAGVVFDTELLRVVAGFESGLLELRGTPYDGSHGPIPRCTGAKVFETRPMPGWSHAGRFDDPRDSKYGPLPRSWGRYDGFYLCGDEAVIAYTVGGRTKVFEHYGTRDIELEGGERARAIARTVWCEGIHHDGQLMYVTDAGEDAELLDDRTVAVYGVEPPPGRVRFHGPKDWEECAFGAPSKDDAANGATVEWIESVGELAPNGAKPDALVDGECAQNEDEPARCVFSDSPHARFVIDLGEEVDVGRINVFSWHRDTRAQQRFRVFGSAGERSADGDPTETGWELVDSVDTECLGFGGRHVSSIADEDGEKLGRFRYLLFDVERAAGGTFFSEIDVWSTDQPVELRERRTASYTCVAGGEELALHIDADRRVVLELPANQGEELFMLLGFARDSDEDGDAFRAVARRNFEIVEPSRYLRGGPRRWNETLVTEGRIGETDGPYAVDAITVPDENPWHSRLRFAAFDFTSPTSAALSTWNGDVWEVRGIDEDLDRLEWRRIATGLHDPLGLKVVDGVIHTLGRDGITRLHDLNGDGEIDYFENFNNDVLVTRSFHEFAFDLQRDEDGNFYFSKGGPVRPGGRGFDEIVAHHGTIMKVSPDGKKLEVVATGLRAPNGIAVSKGGVLTSGDNEGTWMPKCRLNWFSHPGMFASCVDTAHMDPKPTKFGDPLCWFPMDVDNSSGGQVWVTSDRWGPLAGRLLHMSYGTCKLFLVLAQIDRDRVQGGVAEIPLSFDSSLMRGRFSEADGQLYLCGFKGWQTRAAKETAFHRVRYTGAPLRIPVDLRVTDQFLELKFLVDLDEELATDPESFTVEVWDYEWSDSYGSAEIKPSDPDQKVTDSEKNRDVLTVRGATLMPDHRTIRLSIDGLARVMQMRINYDLEGTDGAEIVGDIYNTVNYLGEDR